MLDREGKAITDLGPVDFSVTIDRKPRRVVSLRHVSRGPGALSEASVRQGLAAGPVVFVAEPARNVLLVIDQTTLTRGRERAVVQAAGAFLDRLGLDDRVGVLRLPLQSQAILALTTVRPEARETLRVVVGQAMPVAALASEPPALEPDKAAGVVDPDRVADPERPVTGTGVPGTEARPPEVPRTHLAETLPQIEELLRALASVPGRKTVALFSAGIVAGTAAALERTALAAGTSHTVIHAFRIEGGEHDSEPGRAPDAAALERLARMSGGGFASLGRHPEREIERVLSALSSCYVLSIEASDVEDGRHPALRVDVSRQRTTVQAPWRLFAAGDPGDLVAAPPPAAVAADRMAAELPGAARSSRPPAATAERAARDAELKFVMARLLEYADAYQRQYSALVAEEEYWQQDRTSQRTLRSDLLLTKPVNEHEDWVLFRDVFEVNGDRVRDREDRLKELFLDQSPKARSQLQHILDESSRFNIGRVIRNINVPFFALKFLAGANRLRFEFRLAGRQEAAGIDAWRVEYKEIASPTIVRNQVDRQDVPATGWFIVDPVTGAILETRMKLPIGDARGEFTVRFRRDTSLGLWVPSEMRETYMIRPITTYRDDWTTLAEARATYSNFRRFQVTTDERIVIPK